MIKKIDSFMEEVEKVILVYGIIFLALLLVGDVLSRTLFSSSFSFTEEIGKILLMAITFIGMSFVARHGKHIRMSAVYDYGSPKVKKFMVTVIAIITCITLLYLSYAAFNYLLSVKTSARVTSALRIPAYLGICIVFYGFISSAIQYFCIAYLNITKKGLYIGKYLGAEYSSFDSES